MFTSFYSILRSEISKNLLSKFNVFNYSNIYLFKCATVKLLSFYSSARSNLTLNLKALGIRWGLFFYKGGLTVLTVFLLG